MKSAHFIHRGYPAESGYMCNCGEVFAHPMQRTAHGATCRIYQRTISELTKIEAGLKDADAGRFASQEEVDGILDRAKKTVDFSHQK